MRMEPDSYTGSQDADRDSDDHHQQLSDKNHSPALTEPDQEDTHQRQLDPTRIPDSVRGAPEELKPAIRKKQNKESARRSRRRRKELVVNLGQSIDMLVQKVRELENRLDSMEKFFAKSGYEALPQPRLSYPVLSRGAYQPTSDGGPSGSGSIVLGGSDGGSQSRGASEPRAWKARNTGRPQSELDDEDVEKLIASCLGQL